MSLGTPWTQDEDRRLTELHAGGKALHSIAKEMQRSKEAVGRHAGQLGLSWDRTRTARAAEAGRVDNKARRVTIVARMYTRIEKLQDRLEKVDADGGTFRTLVSAGKDGDKTEDLNFVPTVDERNIADTLSRYVASAAKLEAIDSGDKPAQARDLLTTLGAGLGLNDAH